VLQSANNQVVYANRCIEKDVFCNIIFTNKVIV